MTNYRVARELARIGGATARQSGLAHHVRGAHDALERSASDAQPSVRCILSSLAQSPCNLEGRLFAIDGDRATIWQRMGIRTDGCAMRLQNAQRIGAPRTAGVQDHFGGQFVASNARQSLARRNLVIGSSDEDHARRKKRNAITRGYGGPRR